MADAFNGAPGAQSLQGNVFANDTDVDGVFTNGVLNKSKWTARLVDASGAPVSAPAGLTFNSNGTFTYQLKQGAITFFYKIDPGTWTDGTNRHQSRLRCCQRHHKTMTLTIMTAHDQGK